MNQNEFEQHRRDYTQKLIDQMVHAQRFGCNFAKSCGSDCILDEAQSLRDMGNDIKKNLDWIESSSSIPCDITPEGCTGEHDCLLIKFLQKIHTQAQIYANRVKEYEERTGKKI